MPPRAQKQLMGVGLVVDIGANIGDSSDFEKSKKCASRIIERNIFACSLDQYAVILVGSEKTENELDYPNIEVKNKWLTVPNWDMLKTVESLTASNVTADWLDALIVSINLLKNESVGKRFTNLQVVLISNFAAPIKSTDQIEDVVQTMKDMHMNLIVIGLQGSEGQKTDTHKENEALVERILEELGDSGHEFGFEEAMEELGKSKNVQSSPAAWPVDLKIGKNICIPVTGYKKIAPSKPLSWKKTAIAKSEQEKDGEQVNGESKDFQTVNNANQTQAVQQEEKVTEKTKVVSETVFFHKDDQIEKSDVIKGYLFGQTLVPFSDEDIKSLALETEKCLEVLSFTSRKYIHRHMYMGDSATYIVPKPGLQCAAKAVTALVKAMLELDRVGIVRKVYRKGSTPQVGALIPVAENDAHFFYFLALPFKEDDRNIRLPSLSHLEPSEAQKSAVKNLINAMDLSQLGEDDPYRALPDPNKEHSFHQVKMKALYPDSMECVEVSEEVKKMIQPLPQILEKASAALEEIKSVFNLEEVEQKAYRRDAAQFFDRSGTNDESSPMELEDPNLGESLAGFVQSTITEVGTVDPVTDFLKLSEQGEPFDKLCEQMQTAVKKLVLMSSGTMGSKKPISAIKLLRSQCIQNNPSNFNSFIASLKDDIAERNVGDFWDQVVQEKVGLISCEETQESRISAEEAESFYEIKQSESQNEVSYEMEAEDMLDMI